MIKTVIFDMDGVMVETESLYSKAAIEIAKKRGKEFTLEIKQEMMGRLGLESMKIFKERLSLDESPQELLSERAVIYGKLLREEGVKPMPGLFELLDLLDTLKIPYAIASSSRGIWVNFILESLKIKDRFAFIIPGDNICHSKPHPEIYIKTINLLGVYPFECLVLEDAPAGVIAAKKAGARCIAVRNEFNKNLPFEEADMIVESLSEITKELIMKL